MRIGGRPAVTSPLHQGGRLTLSVLFVGVGIAGVAGGGWIAATAGDPPGASIALVYALLPLPLLLYVYWWLDRYEPEPARYKMAAFVWGSVVAVAVALAVEGAVTRLTDLSEGQVASFVAPPVEEIAKGLFLVLTFTRARRAIDGYLDGLVYAGLVGVGFAFVENIAYYATSYLGTPDMKVAGAEGATYTFIVRGVFSPFVHPEFTSMLGIAIGFAVAFHRRWLRVLIIGVGWLASMLLHMLWNGSASLSAELFGLVYLALLGVLTLLAAFAVVLRIQQREVMEQALVQVARRGWIHPAEIPFLARFPLRRYARRYAREARGKAAAAAVRHYQKLATEMAFLHDTVVKNRHNPDARARRDTLLEAMYAMRAALVLPPVSR